MRRPQKPRALAPSPELKLSEAAVEDRRRRRPPQPPGPVHSKRPYGRRKTDRRPGEPVPCSIDPVEALAEIEAKLDDAFGIFENKMPPPNPMHATHTDTAGESSCPHCRASLDGIGDEEMAVHGQICPYCLLPLDGPEPLDQ